MDFVEKEDFLGFERSEDGGGVAFALEKRASTGLDGDGKLLGGNLPEGGLAEARRGVKQNVIAGFAEGAGALGGYLDVFPKVLLADVFFEPLGATAAFDSRR